MKKKELPNSPIVRTTGIFEFDRSSYIYVWFIIEGSDKNVLGCLFKPDEKKPKILFKYRFKYYVSNIAFDPRDMIRVYEALSEDGDADRFLSHVRQIMSSLAEEYGSKVDELPVNGRMDEAVRVLTAHQSTNVREAPKLS